MIRERFVLRGNDDGGGSDSGGGSSDNGLSFDNISFSGSGGYTDVDPSNNSFDFDEGNNRLDAAQRSRNIAGAKQGAKIGSMLPIPGGMFAGAALGYLTAPDGYIFPERNAPLTQEEEERNRSLFSDDNEYENFKRESLANSDISSSSPGSAIDKALRFQEQGAANATARLEQGRDLALGAISPFQEGGVSAFEQQLELLGLSGDKAQTNAIQQFQASPAGDFAASEEEQAIIRNALALGDAGGGRVQDQLAQRASGRFNARLDNNLSNLGQLSGIGQQASSNVANIQQNTASNLSNLLLGTGENQASAVLGQEVARAAAASEANRIAAQERQQSSQQSADRTNSLINLAGSFASSLF
mgnify:CR=1 FL=1